MRIFRRLSGVWIREIVAGLGEQVPVIVFAKGARDWNSLLQTGANVLGIDHGITLSEARAKIPKHVGMQGNLDPESMLTDTPAQVALRVRGLLAEMEGRDGHIFNLGHGLPPNARLENIQAIIDTLREEA